MIQLRVEVDGVFPESRLNESVEGAAYGFSLMVWRD